MATVRPPSYLLDNLSAVNNPQPVTEEEMLDRFGGKAREQSQLPRLPELGPQPQGQDRTGRALSIISAQLGTLGQLGSATAAPEAVQGAINRSDAKQIRSQEQLQGLYKQFQEQGVKKQERIAGEEADIALEQERQEGRAETAQLNREAKSQEAIAKLEEDRLTRQSKETIAANKLEVRKQELEFKKQDDVARKNRDDKGITFKDQTSAIATENRLQKTFDDADDLDKQRILPILNRARLRTTAFQQDQTEPELYGSIAANLSSPEGIASVFGEGANAGDQQVIEWIINSDINPVVDPKTGKTFADAMEEQGLPRMTFSQWIIQVKLEYDEEQAAIKQQKKDELVKSLAPTELTPRGGALR